MQIEYNRRQIAFKLVATIVSVFLPLLLLLASGLRSPSAVQTRSVLTSKIEKFEVHNTNVLDALLLLGQQERIPMGIELVTDQMISNGLTFNLESKSVDYALRGILQGIPKSAWTEDRGVILIRLEHKQPSLFDTIIPSFQMPRATLQEMSNLLMMDLKLQLNPGIHGFAGHFPPGDTSRSIPPIDLKNSTVRSILNEGVRRYEAAAWVSRLPPDKLDELPEDGAWGMVFYEDPPRHLTELCCYKPQF
jgi:hypothetical protein